MNAEFTLHGKTIQTRRVQEKYGLKPYRKPVMHTHYGTSESGVLNLLVNPRKNLRLVFSHPEALLYG